MHSSGHDGVAFQIHARAFADGGTVAPTADAIDIQGGTSVTVLVAIATSFHGADPASVCRQRVDRAAAIPFAKLRQSHVADHQSLYRRVSLDLEAESSRFSPAAYRRAPQSGLRMARMILSWSRFSFSDLAATSPSPARAPIRHCRSHCKASGTTGSPAAWAGPTTSISTSTRSRITGLPRCAISPSVRRRSSRSST